MECSPKLCTEPSVSTVLWTLLLAEWIPQRPPLLPQHGVNVRENDLALIYYFSSCLDLALKSNGA